MGWENAVGVATVTVEVIRAAIVRDQHRPPQPVRLHQKVRLIPHEAILNQARAAAVAEPGHSTGQHQAIIIRQPQVNVEELIDRVPIPAVAAVDRHPMNADRIEGCRAGKDRFHSTGTPWL